MGGGVEGPVAGHVVNGLACTKWCQSPCHMVNPRLRVQSDSDLGEHPRNTRATGAPRLHGTAPKLEHVQVQGEHAKVTSRLRFEAGLRGEAKIGILNGAP